ncbi:carboxy methyl transferase for protein phosphatase 2A [Zalaria obscura]|uniref:Carboxy methyl transferase for protein phosphatase 2A n=1 Tax=Zalaria obscura TaxID=2024903 RepID=A0ACC3SC21_9PEZI
MAAPQIPNLNTLRGRTRLRGGLRGRGRGGFGPEDPQSEEDQDAARDKIIQQTDNDASSSRMSAVALGYLDDEYARAFIQGQIPRRYPIINRGTYVRTTAIDRLVDNFLCQEPSARKQIISLGAGSDTRFFRRKDVKNVVYHEIDFPSNTEQKISAIERTPLLLNALQSTLPSPADLQVSAEKTALASTTYNIHPLDLRTLASPELGGASSPPQLPNLDPTLPTLVLSECCLCYLPPEVTTSILQRVSNSVISPTAPLALIVYEPIRPYDSFGKTMISNLASRGIHLQTLKKYSSLDAQRLRLKHAGLVDGQGARDIESIYYGEGEEEWITPEERRRIEGLEWLDEVEEWRLLARHYCVAWGWRDGDGDGVFSKAWGGVAGSRTAAENADDEML